MRPATRSCAVRSTPTSTSTSTCSPRRPTTTRSSTCSTPSRARARSTATPQRRGSPGRVSTRHCSRTRPRASCSARSPSSPASPCRRSSCANRTGSRATSRSSPARITAGTAHAASSRSATNRSRPCTAPASPSTTRRVRCCATASDCSASRPPNGCDMSATPASPVELAPRRRRRAWPWVLVIFVVLLAAAAVAADVLVRGIAERAIAQELSSALDVPDDASVEVRIGGGSVLLQALAGGLDRVDVTVDDLALGPLTGDLTIVAEGVPLDPGAATRELRGRYAIPEEALSALAPEVAGVTVDSVHVEGSEVVASGTAVIFGATLELGLGLTPSIVDGDLAVDPTSVRIGADTFTVEQLRANP